MKATYACAQGVQGSAKIDHFNDAGGRLRGEVQLFASDPNRIRFDVISPFGVLLATLTSDGQRFTFFDMKNRAFLEGPPDPCNIARLTQVRMPADALVRIMRGEAPILVHDPNATTIEWTHGAYTVRIPGHYEAVQELRLIPYEEDFNLPFEQQRVKILGVSVTQRGFVHYNAELKDHEKSVTMPPRQDPDGLDQDIQPSGPACQVLVPRRIHVEMPYTKDDLLVHYENVGLNPPLPEGIFTQPVPGGVRHELAICK
jgi:outer membrane lipoprotein-sorting protein